MEDATVLLSSGQELRLAAPTHNMVSVTLVDGDATMCGARIPLNEPVSLIDVSVALYARNGARIQYRGIVERTDVATDAQHHEDLDRVCAELNMARRRNWLEEDYRVDTTLYAPTMRGPRVLVVGETNTGKWTTARTLANEALAHNWAPTLVDLNVGQCGLSVPGSVAARVLQFDTGAPVTSVDMALARLAPTRIFYGDVSPAANAQRMFQCIDLVARAVRERLAQSVYHNASGCVINTCGWINLLGLELIEHAIGRFVVDHVLVLDPTTRDAEALMRHIQERFGRDVRVHKVTKSTGVVVRNSSMPKARRQLKISDHFNGRIVVNTPASVHSVFDVSYSIRPHREDLELFEIIEVVEQQPPRPVHDLYDRLPKRLRVPNGSQSPRTRWLQVRRVNPFDRERFRSAVAARLLALPLTERDREASWVLTAPVLEFVEIREVDLPNESMTLGQSQSTAFPKSNNCLLVGNVKRENQTN